ncbi:hypothetical protein ACF09J_07750 [Streptomyces sp. NPDC014889]|uniref:hypothetical protein n=1 Tax=Streptomyces sp. NPDC014889 TaxID=3364928 RepID=UPI0037001478
MPYRYTCHQCQAQSPAEHPYPAAAEADRQEHRNSAHGGLAPLQGDGIHHVHAISRGDGILPRHSCLAALFLLALILANCWGR